MWSVPSLPSPLPAPGPAGELAAPEGHGQYIRLLLLDNGLTPPTELALTAAKSAGRGLLGTAIPAADPGPGATQSPQWLLGLNCPNLPDLQLLGPLEQGQAGNPGAQARSHGPAWMSCRLRLCPALPLVLKASSDMLIGPSATCMETFPSSPLPVLPYAAPSCIHLRVQGLLCLPRVAGDPMTMYSTSRGTGTLTRSPLGPGRGWNVLPGSR